MALTKVSSGLISADASSVDLNIDAGTLYIDATNNRVGIGNTSPNTKLDISGNVALNASTVNPWRSAQTIIQLNEVSTLTNYGSLVTSLEHNSYIDSGGTRRYIVSGQEVYNIALNSYENGIIVQTAAAGTAGDAVSLEEKFRITTGGNVGIGTSGPSSKLNVVDTSSADATVLRVANGYTTDAANDASTLMFQLYRSYSPAINDAGFIKAVKEQAWDATDERDAALTFGTRDGASEPTERMRISSSGNVGINTTNATNLLTIGLDSFSAAAADTSGIYTDSTSKYLTMLSDGFTWNARAGTTHMIIDSSGNVGIGTTSPSDLLQVGGASNGIIRITGAGTGVDFGLNWASNQANIFSNTSDARLTFKTNGSERMRINSSGDLLVGATSNTSRGGSATKQLIKFGSGQEYLDLQSNNATTNSAILFSDGSTGNYGAIRYRHNGDSLEFMTAATERMRIHDDGKISINESADAGLPAQLQINSSDRVINAAVSNTGFTGNNTSLRVERSANSGYQFLLCRSGARYDSSVGDTEFSLRGDGNGYADGSWNGGGADYAEYFEWNDGNPDNEDRVGYAVSLVGNKIKIAEAGEEIIGVVSGNPSVVGDTAWNDWQDKYLKDDFGRYLWEEYADEDGNTTDDNGDLLKRRVLNPDYDDSLEYQPREDRQEWDVVGLMGKLRVRVGQQTNSNWIKLRDISDTVEEWLVR